MFDPKTTQYRGRIVETTGDGVLVEFASVVDAMRCAIEVQRSMAEGNTKVPEDKRIEFRVGIHQGDIISDAGNTFGDAVKVAAGDMHRRDNRLGVTANMLSASITYDRARRR